MAKKFDLLWRLLDIPSGAILGVMSGSFIIMAWVSFFWPQFSIPEGFLGLYMTAVTGVTITKVTSTTTRVENKKEAPSETIDNPDA